MDEKKSKKGVVIVILILIILALGGYIYYTDYYNPKVKTITKTKTVTKTQITDQTAQALARQSFYDHNDIFNKFKTETANDSSKITNYEEIITKYYTKDGKKDFENYYINESVLEEKDNVMYLYSKGMKEGCELIESIYDISDYNSKSIDYTVSNKYSCTENDTQKEETDLYEMSIAYEDDFWKIDAFRLEQK